MRSFAAFFKSMLSKLYECRVMHERFAPTARRFVHPLFYFSLELEELGEVDRQLALFSVNRMNLYSFRESDYFPSEAPGSSTLRSRVLRWLQARGVEAGNIARIQLITLPRVAGYLFNPVSFYYCYDAGGAPLFAVAEVTNTFREVKPYLLDGGARAGGGFRLKTAKDFYVSPFSEVDTCFDFRLHVPGKRLAIRIDNHAAGRRNLTSTVGGLSHPLTDRALAWFSLKYPFVTLRTTFLIHWHALCLYFRRTPWFPKAARVDRQTGLYRPHRSIRPRRTCPAPRNA